MFLQAGAQYAVMAEQEVNFYMFPKRSLPMRGSGIDMAEKWFQMPVVAAEAAGPPAALPPPGGRICVEIVRNSSSS